MIFPCSDANEYRRRVIGIQLDYQRDKLLDKCLMWTHAYETWMMRNVPQSAALQ